MSYEWCKGITFLWREQLVGFKYFGRCSSNSILAQHERVFNNAFRRRLWKVLKWITKIVKDSLAAKHLYQNLQKILVGNCRDLKILASETKLRTCVVAYFGRVCDGDVEGKGVKSKTETDPRTLLKVFGLILKEVTNKSILYFSWIC